jgi:hypothetical protein
MLAGLAPLLSVIDPDVALDASRRCDAAWGATARVPASGSVEVARRANDRRLAAAVARGLGEHDAVIATTMEELEAALGDHWIAKATICAAGRDRVRRRGRALDDATRVRLERLMARGGALIVEPWRERTLDLGQPGIVGDDGAVELAPPHLSLHDEAGGFRGIVIGDPRADAYAAELAGTGRAAGAALARVGYRGRFVVDAFVHPGGLRSCVEINARWTFGWVARLWAERLGPGTLDLATATFRSSAP